MAHVGTKFYLILPPESKGIKSTCLCTQGVVQCAKKMGIIFRHKAWKSCRRLILRYLTISEGVLFWANPWGPLGGPPRKNEIELRPIFSIWLHNIYSTEGSDFKSTHSHILPKHGGRRCIWKRFHLAQGRESKVAPSFHKIECRANKTEFWAKFSIWLLKT